MTIKNKDGTAFKLAGPNPLVLNQSFWGGSIRFHNFEWQSIITKENTGEEEEEVITHNFIDLKDITPEEIKVPIKETIPPPKKKKVQDPTAGIERVFIHCLPAVVSKTYDALYDETREIVGYGQQFSFEGIIASSSDLALQIWTNLKIDPRSILFISRERRWWRVDKSEPKAEGSLLTCVPSETHPSFNV